MTLTASVRTHNIACNYCRLERSSLSETARDFSDSDSRRHPSVTGSKWRPNEQRLRGSSAGRARRSKRRGGRLVPTSFARRLIFLPRQALADDQKLRGGRRGDHRRILGFETRHSNRTDEAGGVNFRAAPRTHLAKKTAPFRRRTNEADIAEALDP